MWILYVDDASKLKGSGARTLLKVPNDILLEQSLKLDIKSNKNKVEYKTLIVGMILIIRMSASCPKSRSDSQLFMNNVTGEYQKKEP